MTLIRVDQVTYSLSNNAGGLFAIDSSSGVVTVAWSELFDYETAQSHQIAVTAKPPSDGSSTSQVYTINILDFNEFAITQVTDSDANTNEVSEAALAGTIVGVTAFAEDLDLSKVLHMRSPMIRQAPLQLMRQTGVVTLATAGVLDFETVPTIDLEITATSDDGSGSSKFLPSKYSTLTRPASDRSPTPTLMLMKSLKMSKRNISWPNRLCHDPDTTDQVTYSLSNNAVERLP